MRNVLADTGPIVALFRRRDRHHLRVVRFLRENPCLLLTTCHVVTEAWHLLAAPARLAMMRWIEAGGAVVHEADAAAASRIVALLHKYHDRPMDIADASLVALAERTGIDEILTIDRADFDVYRTPAGRRFVQLL